VAREQRKLAAILAADVVGYSRLMGRDESQLAPDRSKATDRTLTQGAGPRLSLAEGQRLRQHRRDGDFSAKSSP
jgi:hypothetical protein